MSSDPALQPGYPAGSYPVPPAFGAMPPAMPPARAKRPWASSIVILVLLVAAAGGVLVAGIVLGIGGLKSPNAGYALGRSATVTVTESGTQAIFADQDVASGVSCTVAGPGRAAVEVSKPSSSLEVDANGHKWNRVAEFEAVDTGDYVVTCAAKGGAAGEFGVSEASDTRRFIIGLVGGIGGFLLLMAVGVITFLIRMLRRPKLL